MFSEKDLNEFVNRMFDNAAKSNNQTVKEGLQSFRKYLETTKMCAPSYLKKLDKIIECSGELISLKTKVSSIDVTSIIKSESEQKEEAKQKTLGTYPSSSCMNQNTSSRCGNTSSYSDNCGGGNRYSNRC